MRQASLREHAGFVRVSLPGQHTKSENWERVQVSAEMSFNAQMEGRLARRSVWAAISDSLHARNKLLTKDFWISKRIPSRLKCVDRGALLSSFGKGANPCGSGTCVPLKFGRYMCSCADGYELGENGKCVDINECARRTRPCGPHPTARCFNSEGSYTCLCLGDMLFNEVKKTCECKNGRTKGRSSKKHNYAKGAFFLEGRCKPECPEDLDPIDRAVRGCWDAKAIFSLKIHEK